MRGERRLVTALFADLVGSTALGERLDPEDLQELIGPAITRMVAAVEAFDGMVKDLAGDGMLALFGARRTHEDDAERAIRAGLRIVDDLARYAEERRAAGIEGFGVRVGIESGLVVLGPTGAGSRVEYGATGDAVNTAARVQSSAEPLSVLVGPVTFSLVEPVFEWSAPREARLKGKAEALQLRAVLGIRGSGIKRRGITGMEPPLVGRDVEVAALERAAAALSAGAGGILFIAGEAGMGKSRMLVELRAIIKRALAADWLEGRTVSYGQAVPYGPMRELFRAWLAAPAAAAGDVLAARLRERLATLLADEASEAHLATMLGYPVALEAQRHVASLSPEARRHRAVEAAIALFSSLARRRAQVLVIEDLHWADAATLQLLERLTSVTASLPLLIVLTHRPERAHPSWLMRESVLRDHSTRAQLLTLSPLTEASGSALLEAMLGANGLPAETRDRVLATADGNPFYLEEIVRSFIDRGALTHESGGWRLRQPAQVEVPPTVGQVILARMDRLTPEARELIQVASVLGRGFQIDLLSATAGDPDWVQAGLPDLATSGLLGPDPNVPRGLLFKHVLIQETAYNNLLKRHRRELHARAARAISAVYADTIEAHQAILGQHWREAGLLHEALQAFERAANQAQQVYAVEAAIDSLSAAIGIAEQLGSGRALALSFARAKVHAQAGHVAIAREGFTALLRKAELAHDAPLAARASNELGFLLAGAVSYGEALRLLQQALRMAQQLGMRDLEAIVASRLSIVYTNTLRFDLAIGQARTAQALALEIRDDATMAAALDALQVASVLIGDMTTVEEISGRLVELHRRRGDLWYLQLALFQWAWADVAAARWDPAEEMLRQGLAVNRSISDRGNEPTFLATLGWVARARGAYASALSLGRQAVTLAREAENMEFLAWAEGLLGRTLLELLETDEALGCFQRSLAAATAADAYLEAHRAACYMPLLLWLTGQPRLVASALRHAEAMIDTVTVPADHLYLQGADAVLAVAELHLMRGQPETTLRLTEAIGRAAREAGWHEVETAAGLATGRAHAQLGRFTEAVRLLSRAHREAQRFGMLGIVWRAQSALASACRQIDPHAARAHSLESRRTCERLAAEIGNDIAGSKFRARSSTAIGGFAE